MGGKQKNRSRQREQHRQKRQKRRQGKLRRSLHSKAQQPLPDREEVRIHSEVEHAPSALPGSQAVATAVPAGAATNDQAPVEPRMDWALATTGVPAEDVLDGLDVAEPGDLAEAVRIIGLMTKDGDYLAWEAVVRQEQGMPLSEAHESQLDELMSFVDDEDEENEEERILYINGMARPVEPWYETVGRLTHRLLLPVVRTDGVCRDVDLEGWRTLREALNDHCRGLSLPRGVATPLDVVPAELRHRLELQDCLVLLVGIGQQLSGSTRMTLRDPEQLWRVDEFVEDLGKKRESVAFLAVTLEGLRKILVMPATDREIFEALLREKLHLDSDADPFAEHLTSPRAVRSGSQRPRNQRPKHLWLGADMDITGQ